MTMCRDTLQKLIDCYLIKQIKTQSEDPSHGGPVHSLEVTPLGLATYKGISCTGRVLIFIIKVPVIICQISTFHPVKFMLS